METTMDIVTARLLDGIPHGFTTRRGGVSPAPFDTLNLGGAVGDEVLNVAINWSRLSGATGLSFARVRQVHGTQVVHATTDSAPGVPRHEADAVISGQPGLAACVSVADCVPILIADPRSRTVAAVHAGWRGTIAGIAREVVQVFQTAHDVRPEELLAVIGPSIGPCCYEVSAELAERFARELGSAVVRSSGAGKRLDLWLANQTLLRAAGVQLSRIETLGRCTACETEIFFSHRRDRGRTGRQVAFIAPRC